MAVVEYRPGTSRWPGLANQPEALVARRPVGRSLPLSSRPGTVGRATAVLARFRCSSIGRASGPGASEYGFESLQRIMLSGVLPAREGLSHPPVSRSAHAAVYGTIAHAARKYPRQPIRPLAQLVERAVEAREALVQVQERRQAEGQPVVCTPSTAKATFRLGLCVPW